MPRPEMLNYPLVFLNQMYAEGKILIRPTYQREEAWTRYQRQLLVDSIFQNYDVPKIYFRAIDRHGYEYEVIDGQQRLQAVLKFFANEFKTMDEADKVAGAELKNRSYKDLTTAQKRLFNDYTFNVVIIKDFSDDQVEDMYTRLNFGTPLNAAEKRRAYPGNMRNVVAKLAKHPIFKLADFKDKRSANEDVSAKILHQAFHYPKIVDIRPTSIKRTYKDQQEIEGTDRTVKTVAKVLNFLNKALKNEKVVLKRYALLSLFAALYDLAQNTNALQLEKEFGKWYVDFNKRYSANALLDPDDENRNVELSAYQDAARNDSVAALTYRFELLVADAKEYLGAKLRPLDRNRLYTREQRHQIFAVSNKKCEDCERDLTLRNFEVDHIEAHAHGGKTIYSNARILCRPCNAARGKSGKGTGSAKRARRRLRVPQIN